ncbi:MAG TPA: anti-sigma factor [Blastocatellia bacterium]|nr:anti-sigma factor [Blastocatellia bacterium]
MISCRDFIVQLPLYLDDELRGDERSAFEAHLDNCANCRSAIIRENDFLKSIREARPLYPLPINLEARIQPIISGNVETRSEPDDSQTTVFASRVTGKKRYGWISLAAAVLIVFVISTIYLTRRRDVPLSNKLSEFAMLAVDTHLRHLRGQLPLEIKTTSPEEISDWFANKVSFSLKLPHYQESSGQEKLYELQGARLVGFKSDYAAYVAYEMKKRPITLVVTSNSVAMPSGGEELLSKGMTFHWDSINGLKVITWSDRGLTYALVSDLDERGQQSCVVCHQGTKDRDFIENLKPAH